MPTSPTQLTLKRLRKEGYIAEVVERWNHFARIRQDLFGIVDVLAIRDGVTLGVQCTSWANVAARLKKAKALEVMPEILKAWEFEVWGWKKKGHRWEVRREVVG